MRGRVLAVALAAVAVALPARASTPAAVPPAPDAGRAAWLAERALLAGRLPLDPALHRRDDDKDERHWATFVPVGDLDGDGGRDAVDVRYMDRRDPATGLYSERMRLDAYRGRDGRALWSRDMDPASASFPLAAPVGLSDGVVVVSYVARSALVADSYDTVVRGLDAGGGVAWERSFTGGGAYPVVATAGRRTYADGLARTPTGTGLVLATTVVGTGPAPNRGRTQVSVVDTATGVVREVGEPVEDALYGLRAVAAGDLDGDRHDDVVLVDAEERGRGAMTALSLRTGRRLWQTTSGLPANDRWIVRGLPDVTGDGLRDLALSAVTMRVEGARPASTALVDGRTGRVAWTRPGDGAVAIGDVDRRRGSEVAIGDPRDARLALAAYDAAGRAVWRVTRSLPANDAIHTEASWTDAGDLAPDGVRDIGFAIESRSNDVTRRDEGVVDGRTGRVRRDAVPRMVVSVAPIDRRGSDTYTARGDGALVVVAYRGNGPDRLWEVRAAAYGAVVATRTYDADGDGCADVVVTMSQWGGGTGEYALSGATGKPMWSLVRRHFEAGRVGRPAITDHNRFARCHGR